MYKLSSPLSQHSTAGLRILPFGAAESSSSRGGITTCRTSDVPSPWKYRSGSQGAALALCAPASQNELGETAATSVTSGELTPTAGGSPMPPGQLVCGVPAFAAAAATTPEAFTGGRGRMPRLRNGAGAKGCDPAAKASACCCRVCSSRSGNACAECTAPGAAGGLACSPDLGEAVRVALGAETLGSDSRAAWFP